jgi:hypothetical protein
VRRQWRRALAFEHHHEAVPEVLEFSPMMPLNHRSERAQETTTKRIAYFLAETNGSLGR